MFRHVKFLPRIQVMSKPNVLFELRRKEKIKSAFTAPHYHCKTRMREREKGLITFIENTQSGENQCYQCRQGEERGES